MKLAVLSAGAPRHGISLTKQLQDISDESGWGWEVRFLEWRANGYDDYDLADFQWCWWEGCFERVFEFMLMQPDTPHIARWIGTDLLQHQELVRRGYPDPFHAAAIHLADAPNLVEEAKALTGREVGLVRSVPPEAYSPTPITRWDRVLNYCPIGREDFFRWSWTLEIARDYPDITFHVLAREDVPKEAENVIAHLEISGREKLHLFEQSFVYLRPIEHDGIGLTAIECFELGRFVFHSDTRLFGAIPARSVGEIEFHLDELLRRKEPPSPDIARYYADTYSRQRLAQDLGQLRERMESFV